MWGGYWADRYWAPTFWPNVGKDLVYQTHALGTLAIARTVSSSLAVTRQVTADLAVARTIRTTLKVL